MLFSQVEEYREINWHTANWVILSSRICCSYNFFFPYGKSHTYTIEKILGQGSFGITYLAMTQVKVSGALGELETTIQVAIKEFFMKDINGREENTVTCGSRGGVYYDYKRSFRAKPKT